MAMTMLSGVIPGLLEPGNIDLHNRPTVHNPDGTISTVRSATIEENSQFILIPTVIKGSDGAWKVDFAQPPTEAIAYYHTTGEHLGKFDTEAHADAYAIRLHQEQETEYVGGGSSGGRRGNRTNANGKWDPRVVRTDDLNDWQFQVLVIGPQQRRDVSEFVTSITWDDTQPMLTGTLVLQTAAWEARGLTIRTGNLVQLSYASHKGGAFTPLWRLRARDPNKQTDGQMTVNLVDGLMQLDQSVDDFKYVKGKAKKKGWLAHEVAADIARKYGFQVKPAVATHFIRNLERTDSSPYSTVIDAYAKEQEATGRVFVVSMWLDRMLIEPLHRSPVLREMGPNIIQAALSETLPDEFATALTMRNTAKDETTKDKKKNRRVKHRKLTVTVRSEALIKRFGLIQIKKEVDADSTAELEKTGKRILAKLGQPNRDVPFSHPGIPTLKRGAALRLTIPDLNLAKIVYVTGVSHAVAPGDYRMNVSVRFTDPVDEMEKEIRRKRHEAATKRGRPHTDETPAKASPPRNTNRGNVTPGQYYAGTGGETGKDAYSQGELHPLG